MHTLCYRITLLAVALLLVPAVAVGQNVLTTADGSQTPDPTIQSSPDWDLRDGTLVPLTQSHGDHIESGHMLACGVQGGGTRENSWFRNFPLPIMDLEGELHLSDAMFGMEGVTYSGAPTQTGELRFYHLASDDLFVMENLQLVGTATFDATEDLSMSVVDLAIDVTVDPSYHLVVELYLPDCIAADSCNMRAGGNASGEDAPTYLMSEPCGIAQPTPVEDVQPLADNHWVLTLLGKEGTVDNEHGATAHDVIIGLFPNPVVHHATIQLNTQASEHVTVTVVDMLGRAVATLHDGPASGQLDVNLNGAELASGTYVVNVQGESFQTTRLFTIAH